MFKDLSSFSMMTAGCHVAEGCGHGPGRAVDLARGVRVMNRAPQDSEGAPFYPACSSTSIFTSVSSPRTASGEDREQVS